MLLELLLLTIILLLNVYIFVKVLVSKQVSNDRQRYTFALLVFFIIVWVITIGLTEMFFDMKNVSLIMSRASFASGAIVALIYYFFAISYLKKSSLGFRSTIIITVLGSLALISFTPSIVSDVHVVNHKLVSTFGDFYSFYGVMIGLSFIYTAVTLYKGYLEETNKSVKIQIGYILAGTVTSISLTLFTNLIIPALGLGEIRVLGPLSLIFFVYASYYALVRFRFFSTRKVLVNILDVLLTSIVPYIVFYVVHVIMVAIWGDVFKLGAMAFGYLFAVAFVILFFWVNNRVSAGVEGFVYGDDKDINDAKNRLLAAIEHTVKIEEVEKVVRNIISDFLGVKTSFFLLNSDNDQLIGFNDKFKIEIKGEEIFKLAKSLSKYGSYITDEYAVSKSRTKLTNKVKAFLEHNHIHGAFLGRESRYDQRFLLLVSEKDDETAFSVGDVRFLKFATSLATVAFSRAGVYEEVEGLSERLEAKVAEQTLEIKQKNKMLKETLNKERDMLDIMSHELRTPLSVVTMYTNSLLEKIEGGGAVNTEKYRETLNKALLKQKDLLDTLLNSSKLTSDKLTVRKTRFSILSLLDKLIDKYSEEAREKNIKLRLINEGKKLFVKVDKDLSDTMFDNILNNAIKFTDKGKISIQADEDKKNVYVVVEDSGIGMPESEVAKLGQKFYRIDQHLNKESKTVKLVRPGGTGLGLYIAFGLAKKQGIKVMVESEVGKGSRFTLVIPKK